MFGLVHIYCDQRCALAQDGMKYITAFGHRDKFVMRDPVIPKRLQAGTIQPYPLDQSCADARPYGPPSAMLS